MNLPNSKDTINGIVSGSVEIIESSLLERTGHVIGGIFSAEWFFLGIYLVYMTLKMDPLQRDSSYYYHFVAPVILILTALSGSGYYYYNYFFNADINVPKNNSIYGNVSLIPFYIGGIAIIGYIIYSMIPKFRK